MKITYAIPAFTKGGAERVVVELANSADAHGHEVTVIVGFPVNPTWMRNRLNADIEVKHMNPEGRGVLGRYANLLPWLWRNRLWLLDQDIVHCHLTYASLAGGAIQALRWLSGRSRPAVVETFHSVGMPLPRYKRALFRWLAAKRDGYALMAEDAYWRGFIREHPELPIRFIPNGISIDSAPPSAEAVAAYRREAGIPPDARWVIGTVGRIVPDRAPLSVIEVFRQIVARTNEPVHFYMGGEGDLTEAVNAAARVAGIADRLHLPGLVAEPALAFAMVDVYLTINVGEVTGVAGLEAAAAARPVIALNTRAGYDGTRDWIWSSPDPSEVAEKAVSLLQQPALRTSLANTQRTHVCENFSSEAMWRGYSELYTDALAKAG